MHIQAQCGPKALIEAHIFVLSKSAVRATISVAAQDHELVDLLQVGWSQGELMNLIQPSMNPLYAL
jgi:hypothetical protein